MTVGELRRRMGQHEFLSWQVYYARKQQKIEAEQQKAGMR